MGGFNWRTGTLREISWKRTCTHMLRVLYICNVHLSKIGIADECVYYIYGSTRFE